MGRKYFVNKLETHLVKKENTGKKIICGQEKFLVQNKTGIQRTLKTSIQRTLGSQIYRSNQKIMTLTKLHVNLKPLPLTIFEQR